MERPDIAIVPIDPVGQKTIIIGQVPNLGSRDLQTEILPAVVGRIAGLILPMDAEIFVGDVESADQGATVVGNDHFLMIADKIARREIRTEDLELAAGLDQRRKKLARSAVGAETVDHHLDLHAPVTGRNQYVEYLPAGAVVFKHVEEQFEAVLRAFEQVDQCGETDRRDADEPQPVASDFTPLGWIGIGYRVISSGNFHDLEA